MMLDKLETCVYKTYFILYMKMNPNEYISKHKSVSYKNNWESEEIIFLRLELAMNFFNMKLTPSLPSKISQTWYIRFNQQFKTLCVKVKWKETHKNETNYFWSHISWVINSQNIGRFSGFQQWQRKSNSNNTWAKDVPIYTYVHPHIHAYICVYI